MSAGEAMSTAGDSQPDSNKLESVIQVRAHGDLPQAAYRAIITGTTLDSVLVPGGLSGVIIARVASGQLCHLVFIFDYLSVLAFFMKIILVCFMILVWDILNSYL